MSTPNSSSVPRFHHSSSTSLSILIPSSSTKYPWFHQAGGHKQEFAPNTSVEPPSSRRTHVLSSTPERDLKPVNHLEAGDNGSTSGEEKEKKVMNLNRLQSPRPGAIWNRSTLRSQRVRLFHDDQPYPRQVSPTSKPHQLPLELPHPTSPTRRKAFRRRTWQYASVASLQRSRLLRHPSTYLALYFTLNLSLTLYNKSLLINFPFPYTLSALHALCGSIGSLILVRNGSIPVPRLNTHETLILLAFSGLYTINIIVSNVSLGLVTVPFHQVIRASTPLFTILFSALILGTRSSRSKLVALLPVVAGVGFATYGDYYFTPWGFFLTLLGTVLASLKTIYTNFLQAPSRVTIPPHTYSHVKSSSDNHDNDPMSEKLSSSPPPPRTRLPSLSPMHLLYLLSPLAFIQTMLIAHFSGELQRVREYSVAGLRHPPLVPNLSNTQLVLLLMNGVMAFGLNVVSFTANRKVGALSMTVAANVKQVLTILCAVMLFDLTITPMNAVGIALTLVGGAVYASVELKERRERASVL